MRSKFIFILVPMLTGLLSIASVQAQHFHHHHSAGPHHITGSMVEFNQDMRKLWEDHITWTRNVIFNILDNLPGTNEAVARLLQNQDDIGDAIKPFYGNAAGDQLAALLKGHITTAADLLVALRDNDAAGLAAANTAWYANADSIVQFLHAANPDNWSLNDLGEMMDEHLDLTTSEAAARKNMDYAADVAAYDSVHLEILEMADMLSMGIIRQFPGHFMGNGNRTAAQDVVLSDDQVSLEQNSPNPFTEQTLISYFIPEGVSSAEIQFYNGNGTLIKTVKVENGEGVLTVNAANLRSGTYTYSIIADGRILDTKKMVH
jgi:hypothetical protein